MCLAVGLEEKSVLFDHVLLEGRGLRTEYGGSLLCSPSSRLAKSVNDWMQRSCPAAEWS